MILGIDLGAKTTGLAISNSNIATPYKTITHKTFDQALSSMIRIIELEKIDTVVIGFVEGKIKKMFVDFTDRLRKARPDIKVILWDETLTSGQARQTMIKLQLPKFKRRQNEHVYAAALILQSYLDENL